MSGNAEKTKFSIRVDTKLVELADAYIKDSTVQNRFVGFLYGRTHRFRLWCVEKGVELLWKRINYWNW